ncbi:[protein-PII] uridylyltransferase [Aestuariivirga litoralis]|uniref:[protein-PII] uridylyltransferase n=1 Tax=Aestuariivirga litoralis TaxID=2650924 RepID=UPI0018C45A93
MTPAIDKFRQELLALTSTDRLTLRNEASALIRICLAESHAEAEAQLLKDGRGTACAEAISRAEDEIIKCMWAFALDHIAAGAWLNLAVIAVGGYGRGTLAPGSDIDLLFLLPGRPSKEVNEVVEFLLYALWDARQKVGHATRQVDDCLRLAKTDNTILTSILEARYICGEQKLFGELVSRFKSEIVATMAKKFVTEKLAERDARHSKSGESRYAVEPDLKDGKGGLRDLHTLFWIAKFLFNANSPQELADKSAFSISELHKFLKCEDFLWAVRCHLHFISTRGEDRLSFDRQSELAERLHYKSHGGLQAVERFMRHYFLIAKDVGDLTRIFCASLEQKHLKDVPGLSRRFFGRFLPGAKTNAFNLPNGFKLENGRISVVDDQVFARDPVAMLRIFKLAGDNFLEIHPDALKLIRKSFRLIDDRLRNDKQANAIFLSILCDSETPEALLRLMNEAGVLGRFIPDFGLVVAMMQFNMYHHYTVDEHLIRAVGVLTGIENGTLAKDHPRAAELFPTLTGRRSLYVATLLHDIAKGRTEDHSVAGERIARALCPRLGLSADETDLVAWLIRWHLLMSETSQMRDLNDFKTILDFTKIVQTPERLKLLLILTVADIRAVGPGVWNGWKGQLLRALYVEAEPVLTGGHTSITRKERVGEAQGNFFAQLGITDESEKLRLASRHYDAYWLNVPTERQLRHHALIAQAVKGDVVTDITTDAFSGITEITVLAPDHPRLLAMITGAVASAGGNIIGAHIFTTTDGMAVDTILLTREFQGDEDENRRARRISEVIRRVLYGQVRLREELARVQHLPDRDRARAFTVPPRVVLDNGSSNKNTIIEISGLDRVGLLHALTEALFHLNLNIGSAHITTFGEKAVDVFYVTDLTGAKIENPTRIAQIEKALLGVLTPTGRDRAA